MTIPLRFRRLGRAWHPELNDGDALAGVLDLDEALWIATAAPVGSFRADAAFLAYLDADRDGRIRVDEVRAAIRWLLANVTDPDEIRAGNDTLRLASLPPGSHALLATARRVLERAGTPAAEVLPLAAVRAVVAEEHARYLAETRCELPVVAVAVEAGAVVSLSTYAAWSGEPDLVRLVAPKVAAGDDTVQALEKRILYQAWMLPFVNSFVACRDLYQPGSRSLFSWGSLVLDGRRFSLAVKVPDSERHELFTRRGAMCVMYVQVGDRDGDWEYEVAIPVTAGMRGVIVEGMWGVFVEHSGRERHARVRKLIRHPISMRDAIFSPFRRLSEALQNAVERADAADTRLEKVLAAGRDGLAPPPPTVAPNATVVSSSPGGTGMLAIAAGAGIALAAVGSALTYISDRLVAAASTIGAWIVALPMVNALPADSVATVGLVAYPIAVAIVILSVLAVPCLTYLVPVCIAAWLKLRRRDLGTLLIGSGWAVNRRLYITRDVAGMFTRKPSVPRSQRHY